MKDLYNLMITAKLQKSEGGGGDITVEPLSVTQNGTYTADEGKAYSPVNVSVPTGVFPSGTSNITSNGVYDVTSFASASVNVPGIVPSGTSSITANGIYDITNFASVDVNVSGGGGDHDVEDAIIQRTLSGYYENSRITLLGGFAFAGCSSVTEFAFPNAISVFNGVFSNCTNASKITFNNLSTIGYSAFYSCKSLMNLTILGSSVATLFGENAFKFTPMSSSTYTGSFGSIYVPASLVDSYKGANEWRYFSDRITSIVE